MEKNIFGHNPKHPEILDPNMQISSESEKQQNKKVTFVMEYVK